ncbi:recombinase family protein [Acetobacter tropicalis]|uniref:Transposon gamma-delta resolvase n=1 Tax=Acetobacter tropicalis TaxID=104102 RepID=A0A094YXP8_9PROT|nr:MULTISPECIES: recombinase family protein [Acetobacter]KAA8389969.1 recombinase family protein [Acetobacter tropicalis]KAA8393022.1 recombinase family protein [Acetobacter tropicalis]KGB25479.1 transposon gamma-delta resolvase [Acetobacter tropicalis]MBC9008073.1 recombinase family protein [Acetobacter tropicalis]MCG4272987.1 recombinase family protein [Acetobacter senegalensis]
MGQKIGYARVSTVGQTLDIQVKTLKEFGCVKIYREKASGADSERSQLKKLIASLGEGDITVVTRIDRLARSTFDLFSIVKEITNKKAQFHSIYEPWTDTSTSTGRLMLAILGGLADVERDLIRTRTSEGRVRAIQQGKQMGRPSRLTTAQKRDISAKRKNGMTLKSLATTYGLSESAVSRIARSHDTLKTTKEFPSDPSF